MHTDVLYVFGITGIKYPRYIISYVSKHALIKLYITIKSYYSEK